MSAGTLRLIGASNIFPLLSSACQFFSPRWTIIATIRPSILSFLRLPFLVTSPRCIFRVTPLRRRYADCVQCLCVCECGCRWTINRSRSIAFADSGKIGIPSGNTMHKEAYRFEGKTGCAAARYRLYAIVPRFYPSGKPWNGREVPDRCVRSVDYPIPPGLPFSFLVKQSTAVISPLPLCRSNLVPKIRESTK